MLTVSRVLVSELLENKWLLVLRQIVRRVFEDICFGFRREVLLRGTVRFALLVFSYQERVCGLVGLSMVLGGLLRGRYLETRQRVPMRKAPLRRK